MPPVINNNNNRNNIWGLGGFKTLLILYLLITGCVVQNELSNTKNEMVELQTDYDNLSTKYSALVEEFDNYKEANSKYITLTDEELELKRLQIEEELELKKQQEHQELIESYGQLTYENLARTPDKYKGEKVEFTGKVVQIVLESNTCHAVISTDLKFGFDDKLYITYKNDIIDYRLLKDDIITIYGVADGLYTGQSVLGQSLSYPKVKVDIIEQNHELESIEQ